MLFMIIECIISLDLLFVFSSRRRHTRCYRDWSSDVCSSDLSRPRNLTASLGWSDSPAWSPDGKRIAFQRKRGTQPEIFTMNADGSDPKALGVFGARAAWSPDSAKIVFQCFD